MTLNTARFTPMPTARTATTARPRPRRRPRTAYRASWRSSSMKPSPREWRSSSFSPSSPPNATRAWRSASFRGTPARTRSSVKASTWKRSSSDISCSNRARRKRPLRTERKTASVHISRLRVVYRRAQCRPDRGGETVPARRLFLQPLPPRRRERVELRLAVVIALAPLRVDEPLMLEAVQRWVERALGNVERLVRNLLDAEQHAVTVQRSERHGLENQHVERARQQIGALRHGRQLS